MKVPPEFNLLCKAFVQDASIFEDVSGGIVGFAVSTLTAAQKLIVADFIDSLLTNAEPAALQQLWESTPAQVYCLKDKDVPVLLREIRKSIG